MGKVYLVIREGVVVAEPMALEFRVVVLVASDLTFTARNREALLPD